MTKFIWQDSYKIGNDNVDKQHRYLFDLANEIIDPNNDSQKSHHNVLALYHYVREHFTDEEAIMKQNDYSGYQEHKKEHELLTKRLAEISTGIISGETSPDDIMSFMRFWLLEHILEKDMLFGDFLRQQICMNQ